MSPQVVAPGVFWQAEPFAPFPLAMQAKAPDASFAEQVWPAGHEKGLDSHPSGVEDEEEEQAATDEPAASKTKKREVDRLMAGSLAPRPGQGLPAARGDAAKAAEE